MKCKYFKTGWWFAWVWHWLNQGRAQTTPKIKVNSDFNRCRMWIITFSHQLHKPDFNNFRFNWRHVMSEWIALELSAVELRYKSYLFRQNFSQQKGELLSKLRSIWNMKMIPSCVEIMTYIHQSPSCATNLVCLFVALVFSYTQTLNSLAKLSYRVFVIGHFSSQLQTWHLHYNFVTNWYTYL